MRAAVQIGGGTARIAAPGAGGAPRVLAELPRGVLREPADLPGLLAGVLGPVPDGDHTELVLVHPTDWPTSRVAAWAAPLVRGGVAVVPVAAPVAAAAATGARVVLDVGSTGAEAAVVERGSVVRVRRCSVGGDRLDAVAARLTGLPDARATREALSLLPVAGGIDARRFEEAVTPLLREIVGMLRGAPGPVLLVGGVARMPLLAELVDAAGVAGCRVAARPESAAVLGALALPACAGAPVTTAARPPVPLLPEPAPRPRPVRRVLHAVAALVVAAALLGAGVLLRPPEPVAAVSAQGMLVQYGYRFDMPAGWEHSGGLPERRRSLLTPIATPEGSDLIAVERTPLGYDAGAEPERARAELRATFDAAVAAGSALTGYGSTEIAGRPVTTYLQGDVEWFVVLDGDAQLSVGCRHTPAGERGVRAACAVVVGSVRRS